MFGSGSDLERSGSLIKILILHIILFHILKVKNGKLDLRKNFFSVRASSRWNKVPLEMKRIMPVHLFRRAYRRHRDAMLPDA